MWLVDIVLDLFGYTTAKAVIEAASFDRVRVEETPDPSHAFLLGVRRNEAGQIEVAAGLATALGLVMWVGGLTVLFLAIRRT